jgi:hypothetical protein
MPPSAASKPRPFKLTAPTLRELPLHKQIADTLAIEIAPAGRVSRFGVIWWSIDIADYGGAVPGTRVGRGIVAGVPDVFLLYLGQAHHIEIKTDAPTSILSDAQRSVCAGIIVAGGRLAVARNAEEVLAVLDAWNIPRNNRTQVAA